MTTKRKKSTPFATALNGKLYVKLKAIMHPLCAMCDGLPVTFFGKEKTAYLDINTALEWCKKESEHHDKEKYAEMITIMEKAKLQEADKN